MELITPRKLIINTELKSRRFLNFVQCLLWMTNSLKSEWNFYEIHDIDNHMYMKGTIYLDLFHKQILNIWQFSFLHGKKSRLTEPQGYETFYYFEAHKPKLWQHLSFSSFSKKVNFANRLRQTWLSQDRHCKLFETCVGPKWYLVCYQSLAVTGIQMISWIVMKAFYKILKVYISFNNHSSL